jgi:hypothetical protein
VWLHEIDVWPLTFITRYSTDKQNNKKGKNTSDYDMGMHHMHRYIGDHMAL